MSTENNIYKLPTGNYQGYYWMSDATDPVIVAGLPTMLQTLDANVNPFVIEAQLYDPENHLSFSIKYVDGRYVVTRYDVKEKIDDVRSGKYDFITLKKYIANRMPGRELRFFQYWEEQPDNLCEGFPVLQPAGLAFVGFKTIKEKN
ncbi:MAG: TIGR04423 family type III CRISPR-associated protein [Bacteroides sp.]|nr:TIGR04423 family type III CRISPR-associated protein [Bacteroides sp.]